MSSKLKFMAQRSFNCFSLFIPMCYRWLIYLPTHIHIHRSKI
jgi:hypothetical protein